MDKNRKAKIQSNGKPNAYKDDIFDTDRHLWEIRYQCQFTYVSKICSKKKNTAKILVKSC